MTTASDSYPTSYPLLPSGSSSTSTSTSTSTSSTLYNDKHVRFDVPRNSEDEDDQLDLDSEMANMDESHSLLPFSLPWRRGSASSSSSSGSSGAGYTYIKSPNGHRNRNRRHRPIIVSFGILVFASLLVAYLVIGDFLPQWPGLGSTAGSHWWPSTHSQPSLANTNTPDWVDAIISNGTSSSSQGLPLPFDSTNVLIPTHTLSPAPPLLQDLEDRLPYPILEEYFSTGLLPYSLNPVNAPKQHNLDIVYLWVNATSPYLQKALEERAKKEGLNVSGKKRHWRDNGELRGAVRSALKSLGSRAGKVHVLSADLSIPQENKDVFGLNTNGNNSIEEGVKRSLGEQDTITEWRLGQIPTWLDWKQQGPLEKLKWHFHSDVFRLPSDYLDDNGKPLLEAADGTSYKNEEEWRNIAMPSFNSFAIESRMSWIDGLSENFIACNDDMFMMRELSLSDFRNPLLGNVIRMDPGLLVEPFMKPSQVSDSGEWGGLQHANQLLSSRFAVKKRMYMNHLPKAQAKALAHEASVMWAKELTLAATRGFRESKKGKGDVEMAWLIQHLRMERWREALLWSWIVGKVGGVDGIWGEESRDQVREVLNMKESEGDEKLFVELARGERKTLDDLNGLMNQAGWESPKATKYHFSSMDGHIPGRPEQTEMNAEALCSFNLAICLAPDFFAQSDKAHSASDVFKRIAFESPVCGDCLINALIRSSGERGINAFFPEKNQVFYPSSNSQSVMWERSEPMLPLVGTWGEGDFSMSANVRKGQDVWQGAEAREDGGVELRRWCIKLLSRYNYVFSDSPSRFSPIKSSPQLSRELQTIDNTPDLAMVCINDDLNERAAAGTAKTFGDWMEKHWGGQIDGVDWEKSDIPWTSESEVKTTSKKRRIDERMEEKIKTFGGKSGGRTKVWTGPTGIANGQ